MGFFSRLRNLFSSNINAALDAAEDPEMALDQIVRDMSSELRQTKSYLAEAIVNAKKLERDHQKHAQIALDYRQKAKIILTDDDESNDYLAKEALLRQKENEQISEQYKSAFDKQQASVDSLKRNIQKMERKVQEAKAKKSMLLAKQQIAKTQTQVLGATSGAGDGHAFAEFKRIEDKIDDLATRSEVDAEIHAEANIEEQLEEIEFGHDVDLELESLRKELLLEDNSAKKQISDS